MCVCVRVCVYALVNEYFLSTLSMIFKQNIAKIVIHFLSHVIVFTAFTNS